VYLVSRDEAYGVEGSWEGAGFYEENNKIEEKANNQLN
jgi:hypothetical protein